MNRRGFLIGLGSMMAAPAIVHAGNLMPIKVHRLVIEVMDLGTMPALDQSGVPYEAYASYFRWNGGTHYGLVDADIVSLTPDQAKFRASEDMAHIEGIALHEGVDLANVTIKVLPGMPPPAPQLRDYGDVKTVRLPWAAPR